MTKRSRPPANPLPAARADLAATAALGALTLCSAASFGRVFIGTSWVFPVLATALGVHASCLAMRRYRLRSVVALPLGVLAIWLLGIWTVIPSATFLGIPSAATLAELTKVLQRAEIEFEGAVAPTAATSGFKLLAAWGVGLIALLGDTAAFRARSTFQGAAPGFTLFVVCCALARHSGRAWAIVLEVLGILTFVLVQHNTVAKTKDPWFGGRSTGAAAWGSAVGAGLAATAVVAAVVVVPALPRSEGRGPLGWKNVSGPGGTRQVISPIVNLQTRILNNSSTPVFTVHSPVRSYWRLTSLDTFTGVQWQSTNSYQSVRGKLPGVITPPPGTKRVVQRFHIQQLQSIWLPAAFDPEAVHGGGVVSYDPVSNSLLTAKPTSDGLTYEVTSLETLARLDPSVLSAAPHLPHHIAKSALGRYVQLPSSVPSSIHLLAEKITAGARSEYAKALALQDFFYGPSFTYSLSPPSDGYGISALENFLFVTRTGYCQQFAGSYAVLARSIGLPTRLAVGFAPGTYIGHHTYQVTDADAHTWPEVYFPKYGWVPFEPTKGGGFQIPGAKGYTGATATLGQQSSSAVAPYASTGPLGAGTGLPGATPHQLLAHPGAGTTSSTSPSTLAAVKDLASSPSVVLANVLLGIAAALVALATWATANIAGRELRWRRRRRRNRESPAQIEVAWQEASELFAWWRTWRLAEETYQEFAERAGRDLLYALGRPRAEADLPELARLASEAEFSTREPDPDQVARARAASARIIEALTRSAPRAARLRRLLDPRLAWSPKTVER